MVIKNVMGNDLIILSIKYCFATDPDDNVEKLCKVFRATSKWKKKIINFPNLNFRKKSVFVPDL